MVWSNAGHNPPLLLRRNGDVETLDPCGPALGIVTGARWRDVDQHLAPGDVLTVEHLPPEMEESPVHRTDETAKGVPVSLPAEGLRLEEVERDLVRQALENTGGNQVRAARLLGISRDALRNRMKKFGFLGS